MMVIDSPLRALAGATQLHNLHGIVKETVVKKATIRMNISKVRTT